MKKSVNELYSRENESYSEKKRTRTSGPIRIGTSLKFREDFFSAAFLYMLHIEVLTG